MKVVLLILLILGAGAGAWFSGLSGLFGYKGQYQYLQDYINYRITLDNEIREWTQLRDWMLDLHKQESDRNRMLLREKAEVTAERDSLLEKEQDLKNVQDRLTVELNKVLAEIEELKNKLSEFGVSSVQEVQEKLEQLEAEVKQLDEEIETLMSQVEEASKKRTEQANELAGRQKEQADYRALLAKNGDVYTIVSVDPEWNFVVIDAGEGSAITPNDTLLVTRNGCSIAKVKVSRIEKTQTVADIIPSTVAKGVRLQAGDQIQLLTPKQSLN